MKKIILIPALISVCSVCTFINSNCQSFGNAGLSKIQMSEINVSEDATESYMTIGKENLNSINIKVVRAFIKDFEDAKNVTWFKATGDGYAAKFIDDAAQTTVRYSSDGTWNYILKRYAENKMSANLRTLVKRTFFDYNIMEVVEIRLPNMESDTIYRVIIKNEDQVKILRICNGEMEVADEFTKP